MKAATLIPPVASMAIAGFASQTIPLTALPKAFLVGLIAASVFVLVSAVISIKRPA
jgi:hypothetical protein